MTIGYPAVRLAALPHRCHASGCSISPGHPYLRTFFPPDADYDKVVVTHRCEACAIAQGVEDYISFWRLDREEKERAKILASTEHKAAAALL